MRKPGGKNADGMPDRGQQVSMIAQDNLKLSAFLFHHRWTNTFDWTVCLMAGQKKLKDNQKDPNMLPTINKSDMAGTMKAINKYFRSHCGVVRASLAYVIG